MKDNVLDFFEKTLKEPKMTQEQLQLFIEELRFFFQVARVKLESKDHSLRKAAAEELATLRKLLEKNPLPKIPKYLNKS